MIENRNEVIVTARVTEADSTADRETALDMIEDDAQPGSTVGGDKNMIPPILRGRMYDGTPHVSQNNTNRPPGDRWRTTRHPGYRLSTVNRTHSDG